MQSNAITHFLCAVLSLLVVGCSSNAPQQKTAKERIEGIDEASEEATSWHCEQGLQTWSCKRRSIADIQRREAERKKQTVRLVPATVDVICRNRKSVVRIGSSRRSCNATPYHCLKQSQAARQRQAEASRSQAPVSLKDLPGDYWAVQLIALSTQPELKAFMAETNLDELTGAVIKVKGRRYYVALLGVYETRAAAELAARDRPATLKGLEPYIRSMASLQTAMDRADSL